MAEGVHYRPLWFRRRRRRTRPSAAEQRLGPVEWRAAGREPRTWAPPTRASLAETRPATAAWGLARRARRPGGEPDSREAPTASRPDPDRERACGRRDRGPALSRSLGWRQSAYRALVRQD